MKFKEEQIENYNSSFVNSIFRIQESDVVYKIKDKNIFVLIEYQTKIDYSMPYRILQYEIAIIKSALDVKKLKNKSYKLPVVIPIILYIGKQRWNANKYLEESHEKMKGVKSSLSYYNIVDINDFTEGELLEDDTLISKMILVEKTKDSDELVKMLSEIIPSIKGEQKEHMIRIVDQERREIQVKLVKNMLKEKLSIELIGRVTGLDKNKIEEIKNK